MIDERIETDIKSPLGRSFVNFLYAPVLLEFNIEKSF